MSRRDADYAATAPWEGITNKPEVFPTEAGEIAPPVPDTMEAVLLWKPVANKWVPVTLASLKAKMADLP